MQYRISDGILNTTILKLFHWLENQWEMGFTSIVIGRFFPVSLSYTLAGCYLTYPEIFVGIFLAKVGIRQNFAMISVVFFFFFAG